MKTDMNKHVMPIKFRRYHNMELAFITEFWYDAIIRGTWTDKHFCLGLAWQESWQARLSLDWRLTPCSTRRTDGQSRSWRRSCDRDPSPRGRLASGLQNWDESQILICFDLEQEPAASVLLEGILNFFDFHDPPQVWRLFVRLQKRKNWRCFDLELYGSF